eukprot:4703875-Ditylum_brightwellii.AAC.1
MQGGPPPPPGGGRYAPPPSGRAQQPRQYGGMPPPPRLTVLSFDYISYQCYRQKEHSEDYEERNTFQQKAYVPNFGATVF